MRCLSIDGSGGLLFCDPGRGSLETSLLLDIYGQCISKETDILNLIRVNDPWIPGTL
jgi:hypothetical protein